MNKGMFVLIGCLIGLALASAPGENAGTLRTLDFKALCDLTGRGMENRLDEKQVAGMKVNADYGKLPLYFIPNQGQVDKAARFYARASSYTLWFTHQGLVFDSIKIEAIKPKKSILARTHHTRLFERDVSRLVFVGANPSPKIVPLDATDHHVNYFIGSDPKKWRTGIQTFQAILYKEVYPNIDLKVYGLEKQIEYDWLVRPGGNPMQIKFRYENVKGASTDGNGDLVIETRFGAIIHKRPVAFQSGAGNSQEVCAVFRRLASDTWSFAIGEYDHGRDLIIDPVVLLYSTYLGGTWDDIACGISVDSLGCVYITGQTCSIDFPVLNSYQAKYQNGSYNAFVTKLNANGNCLVYSDYLGGTMDDYGQAIVVDHSGCAYVTGCTESHDFTTLNPFQENYQGGKYDAFVAKLNAQGDSLCYSTYLGGSADDRGVGITVDRSGCAYLVGETESTNFPTLFPFQNNLKGERNAFVTKLNGNGNGLIYSTYLGGSGIDGGEGIAVDSTGCAYVSGGTNSIDFPTLNPFQANYQGGPFDAFVTKLNASGNGLVYSTYIGGSGHDNSNCMAVDNSGCAYLTGFTVSNNFPTLNPFQIMKGKWRSEVFVTKLNPNGNGLIYSTYLGGSNEDWGVGIAIDSSGCAYVTGFTESADFPIMNPIQANYQGKRDAFVTKLNASGNDLVYSTFLGGSDEDSAGGIAVDNTGCAYLTGCTRSLNFPLAIPFHRIKKGVGNPWDSFVSKLAPKDYLVNFIAGENGNLSGTVPQFVNDGDSTTPVTAVPKRGYRFTNWTGTNGFFSEENPLTLINVTMDMTITANFNNNPPVVFIHYPGNGDHVWGVVEINADASDDSGVARVEFFIDSILKSTVTAAPYIWKWNASQYSQGWHVIKARGYDEPGLWSEDKIRIMIPGFLLQLQAQRMTEKGWLARRQFARISLAVDNKTNAAVGKLVIYRKLDNGIFQVLKEILPGQLQEAKYTFIDKYLDEDKTYIYKAEAFDPAGILLAISNQAQI